MADLFNQVPGPGQIRVPLFYAEINGAQTPYVSNSRVLVYGQIQPGSPVMPGEPVHVQRESRNMFGYSMLTDAVNAARLNAPFQEIWALPLVDNPAGTRAKASISVRKPITARAASTANVTLAGGAPNTVDGVALAAGDAVLVKNQTAGAENGLYEVQTLGTGADGTWVRHASMDSAGELFTGLVVAVTAGTLGTGTSYELGTAGPFVLGTTVLVFGAMSDPISPVTMPSNVAVWIGDIQVQSIVYPTDTPSALASRLAQAINAKKETLCTAVATAGVVEVTFQHAGTAGNSLLLDTDYYGNEGALSGRLFQLGAFTGGSGDPDLTTALANLGDEPFDWQVGPYTDGVSMAAIQNMLSPVSGRWSPLKQLYGQYVGVHHASVSDLMTLGATHNEPTTSIFGVYRAASPIWKWAGAIGGRLGGHLSEAPELARPLQTLDLIGILPPKRTADRPDITERNSLYFAGIASYHADGKVKRASIDRIVTNYRLNEWGSPDASWLDIETRAKAMYSIRGMKAAITGQFPRATLVDENPDGDLGVASPKDIRNVLIHEYKRQEAVHVVEKSDLFAASVIVERNAQDATRVDVFLPADVSNELRIVAVNYTSFLQKAA